MGKPTDKMRGADTEEGTANAGTQVLSGSSTELSQVVFDETPAGLDRTQIWGVWRQEHERCALGLDELANQWRVVLSQIVHDDDVAGVEARAQTLPKEFDEPLGIDRAQEGLVTQYAVDADGADYGKVVASLQGPGIKNALTTHGPSVSECHSDIATRLVDEDQTTGVDAGHRRMRSGNRVLTSRARAT